MDGTIEAKASPYRGSGALTREQFLLLEMRVIAKLRAQGLSDAQIVDAVKDGNLFQYPTLKSVPGKARACFCRLDAMGPRLADLVACGSGEQAAQANLYAMMRVYRLMLRFMLEEVGARLESCDYSLTRADVGAFVTRYQERYVEGGWSESTAKKIRSVLLGILASAGFLDSARSERLRPILLDPAVERGIRENGDAVLLAAFGASCGAASEEGARWNEPSDGRRTEVG